MKYSGYQLQSALHQLARLVREQMTDGGADPVSLSEQGRARAPVVTLISDDAIPQADGPARGVQDEKRYPAATESELERRAGSFMNPPLVREPAPIPKVEPRPRWKR